MTREIFVHAGWLKVSGEHPLIGIYRADRERNSVSFEYDDEWVRKRGPQIDPSLPLFHGRQYSQQGKDVMFGFLSDASPDRWGRGLLLRNEQYLSRQEGRRARSLMQEDFLLGVSDMGRQGGLRFRVQPDGPYLAEGQKIPKLTELRRLEYAARQYERPEELMQEQWIRDLLEPGSSLGGARPKANVRDAAGNLWIAKFPSRYDIYNVGAWEWVTHELALKCGIHVPDAKLISLTEGRATYLSRRFDRNGPGERIHFMSAMTALEETDTGAAEGGKGFLDLAEWIASESPEPSKDLIELFRRAVFYVCVSNTDCHFRNHGFLLEEKGWRLSPAYDINPNLEKETLALPLTDRDAGLDPGFLLETAAFYGLTREQADHEITLIRDVVRQNWRTEAAKAGISASEQSYMKPAFRAAEI